MCLQDARILSENRMRRCAVEDLAQCFQVFVIPCAGLGVVGGGVGFPEAGLVFERHLHVGLMGSEVAGRARLVE